MLYENYYRKITAIARIFHTIRRFRALILLVVSAACVCSTGYVTTQGYVYDKTEFISTYEYGDPFAYEANAVFSDVRYEFSTDGGFSQLLEDCPRMPGTYYVRAVSESFFGNPRYGEARSFTIVPKAVDVLVEQNEIVYGDTPTVKAVLTDRNHHQHR